MGMAFQPKMFTRTWAMVRRDFAWLEVDFRDWVEKRNPPMKRLNASRMEAIFEDGVRLRGFTDEQVRHGAMRGLAIEKQI